VLIPWLGNWQKNTALGGSLYHTPLGARQVTNATWKDKNLNFLYFFHNEYKYNKAER